MLENKNPNTLTIENNSNSHKNNLEKNKFFKFELHENKFSNKQEVLLSI